MKRFFSSAILGTFPVVSGMVSSIGIFASQAPTPASTVSVSNLPRNVRPQWGFSLAGHVYEYYTEEGTTRFAAVFYGQNATIIWSARSVPRTSLTIT
jgi:Protein of unknown function (DUF3048) N-terminal domain